MDVVLSSELQPGMYVCVRTSSVFGWVIRTWTGSPFDHVAQVTAPGEITEATTRGVRRSPLSKYAGALAAANASEAMTSEQADAVCAAAASRVGDRYDWALIPVIALRRLGIRSARLTRICAARDAVICSELVAMDGQAATPQMPWLCGEDDPATVRPDELAARPVMVTVAWT